MKKIFVKTNLYYNEKFRLTTIILKDDDQRYVEKRAETKLAIPHLQNMFEGREKLKDCYPNVKFCSCEFVDKDCLRFPFIEGESLTKKLVDSVASNEEEQFFKLLELYLQQIRSVKNNQCQFALSAAFVEVFGEEKVLTGLPSLRSCVFDFTTNNIICNLEQELVLFDYEWCFYFPIPINFLLFRGVQSLYSNFPSFQEFVPFEKLVDRYQLNNPAWKRMNAKFTEYILKQKKYEHGYWGIQKQYLKKAINVFESENLSSKQLQSLKESLSWYQNRTDQLENAVSWHHEYDKQLKEAVEAKEQRIDEMEAAIAWHSEHDAQLEAAIAWHKEHDAQLQEAIQWHKEHNIQMEEVLAKTQQRAEQLEICKRDLEKENLEHIQKYQRIKSHSLGRWLLRWLKE